MNTATEAREAPRIGGPFERELAHPFDAAAAQYDQVFTGRRLGRWLRALVWEQLAEVFRPGEHLLELGCGTGADAIWLARRGVRVTATDASAGMLEIARQKAITAGVAEHISFSLLDLAALAETPLPAQWFDGAFSNFGALNCLPDRRGLAEALARRVRPRGRVALVLMNPICPWEIAWHLVHGQPRTALRRLRGSAQAHVGGNATLRVWYPSPRRLAGELRPWFRPVKQVGIGALLPPSYLDHLLEQRPRLSAWLALCERRCAAAPLLRWFNDHYLMVFERC